MSFVLEVERSEAELRRIKDEIASRITSLPDNPRILRLGRSAYVINSRDLQDNWSVEHHDFRRQYAFLVSEIERRGLSSILSMLEGGDREGIPLRHQVATNQAHIPPGRN